MGKKAPFSFFSITDELFTITPEAFINKVHRIRFDFMFPLAVTRPGDPFIPSISQCIPLRMKLCLLLFPTQKYLTHSASLQLLTPHISYAPLAASKNNDISSQWTGRKVLPPYLARLFIPERIYKS